MCSAGFLEGSVGVLGGFCRGSSGFWPPEAAKIRQNPRGTSQGPRRTHSGPKALGSHLQISALSSFPSAKLSHWHALYVARQARARLGRQPLRIASDSAYLYGRTPLKIHPDPLCSVSALPSRPSVQRVCPCILPFQPIISPPSP